MSRDLMRQLQYADIEIARGDFVTLSRKFHGDLVTEKLMTFSGVSIERSHYACYAPTIGESKEDTSEGDAIS